MFSTRKDRSVRYKWANCLRQISWLPIVMIALSAVVARGQQLTATLSGIATDPSGARIPDAKVVVKNQATGDIRNTTGDHTGFFSVTALIPGTYTITVSAKGFAAWEENGIVLSQGDSRTVANIHLKIGNDTTAVTVISGADAEVPTDTAEISATLNNELVDSAILQGRNVTELIKMMPGVAFNNGGGAGSSFNGQVTGTNNGPAGSFSANGTQPNGATAIYLDGANLIDPGNAGIQVANINQDMTDSVKYLSASYGAEYAKGPAVMQAFSKSGGQKFHGEAYLYARDSAIGFANDWNTKAQQLAGGNPNQVYPSSFYYIGGNLGGPVVLPWLKFNRNRDKLFFWGGYEKMLQHPYSAPIDYNVPTAQQRAGNYDNSTTSAGVMNAWQSAYYIPCVTQTWQAGCNTTDSPWMTALSANHSMDLSPYFDPNGKIASSLNPSANATPNAANNYSNYTFTPVTPQNRWEGTGKVTYAFNDNNKLWGTYAYQTETDEHPISIWWEPANAIPYPGEPVGKETAHLYLVNYTHVFNATTTNELVFTYSKFVNDNSLSKPNAVSRDALGFPKQSVFGKNGRSIAQMPTFFDGWALKTTDISEFNFYGGIYGNNSFGKTADAPAIQDTFTKIVSSHSIKAGFYWDSEHNLQSHGDFADNGQFDVNPWSGVGTGNVVFDRYIARNADYIESITIPSTDQQFHQWSLWAQDSWKATRKLTVNVGLRADHMGQWYDSAGAQVWNEASYNDSPQAAANTGLLWNKLNSKVPLSGWSSPLFYYNPRLGAAYDVFGNGTTVVRVGFGRYAYQVSGNDSNAAMGGPLGTFDYNTSNAYNTGFFGYQVEGGLLYTSNDHTKTKQLNVPVNLNQIGGSISADKWGDNKTPYADTFSFGVAQALPSHTVMEISYVGSASRNILLNGTSNLLGLNQVGVGAYFKPNPNPYSPNYGKLENISPISGSSDTTLNQVNDYRPHHNYGTIGLFQHGGYANYNSLQVSMQKQSGNLFMFSNFTFGKVLGTRDGSSANGGSDGAVVDPFHLSNNYGPLAYDHTKILNISFSYKLPSPIHHQALLSQVINGWQATNYTTYQDGSPYQAIQANMQAIYNSNSAQPNIVMPSGQQTQSISTGTWFGTGDYPSLLPILICDPRKGLKSGQYFNPNCFTAPLPPTASTYGQMGQWIWPYIRTPHYWGSDLAIFKAFRINDSQRIEARISATNWLNHPNGAFGLAGTLDNQLIFNGYSTGSNLVYNSNPGTTGTPLAKAGYRWMQFAAKYYF